MKKIRKIFILLILIIQIFTLSSFANYDTDLELDSNAAILVEENSGIVVFEKNADEKLYPASTTKILTAILVIENCNLSDTVTVSSSALSSIPEGYVTGGILARRRVYC